MIGRVRRSRRLFTCAAPIGICALLLTACGDDVEGDGAQAEDSTADGDGGLAVERLAYIVKFGGKPTAARPAGISLTRFKVAINAVAGLTAGVGGALLAARTQKGVPSAGGVGLELEAITTVVLVGAALVGGRGTIVGTVCGVVLIGVLKNGLTIMSVGTFYQGVATGTLLIVAVLIQQLGGAWRRPRRRSRAHS